MNKRHSIWLIGVICLAIGAIFFIRTFPAKADFNANDLIDDSVFDNYNSMSATQVDTFLNNNFPQSCISTKNGYSFPALAGYSPSTGFRYGSNVSAGTVITQAATAYKLNPQVILATLEKESSVVSGSASYHCQYINTSMGYDCPDAGSCPQNPATESGFSKQIIHATWMLKFSQQHANGNYNWAEIHDNWDNSDDIGVCYPGPMTQGYSKRGSSSSCNQTTFYDGYLSIDGNTVHLDTGATAALFRYTPHFHGNQLFVSIFESWFGPSRGEGYVIATAYQDNGDPRQWVIYKGVRHLIPDVQTVQAWGLDKKPVLQWDGTYLSSFSIGSDLTRLMRPSSSLDVYFVDGGNCYKIASPAQLAAWNFNTNSIVDVTTYLAQVPVNLGPLSYAIRDASVNSGPVYMVDGGTVRQYGSPDVLTAWEGSSVPINSISHTYITAMGSPGAALSGSKITDGSQQEYQVVAGQKLPASATVTQLYPATAQSVSSVTLNRLVTGQPTSQFIRVENSNTVYMVDASTKHAVASQQILRAWGVGVSPIVNVVTQGNVNLLASGAALNTYEADVNGQLYLMDGRKIAVPTNLDSTYRTTNSIYAASSTLMGLSPSGGPLTSFIKGSQSTPIYLVDNATLKQINSPADLMLWSNGGQVTQVSDYVLNQFVGNGPVGAYVRDGSNEYVMEGGTKHLVSATVKSNWQLSNPVMLNANTLNLFSNGAALGNKLQSQGQFIFVQEGGAYLTVDPNIAGMWGINDAPTMNLSLADEFLDRKMLTRIAHSKTSNDSRLFIVDRGTLYWLSPSQAINLGISGPSAAINPNAMTVNTWTSAVVVDEGGSAYVIDNGVKRPLPSGLIRNQWTGNDYNSVPTMTNGFLNTFPTGISMERAMKGTGPSVYSAENYTKRWIQNPTTYRTTYAPSTGVTDALLSVLPTGSPIN